MIQIPVHNPLVMKNIQYALNLVQTPAALIKKKITKRVVTYLNENESSVKTDGVRRFFIESVEHDRFSKDGRRYLTVLARDLDDGGVSKYRSLHVGGITKIDGRVKTACGMVKTLL